MNTGEKIKKFRKNAGLTQKELGGRLNITAATISAFEKNKTNIKDSTLKKIADALDISVVDLWSDDFLRMIEEADRELDQNQSLMTIAEHFFALLWDSELCLIEVEYLIDEGKVRVVRDCSIEFEFEEASFFNLMDDIFSYFKFKLQDIKKDPEK